QAIAALPQVRSNSHLRVKVSTGQGNWARVPWIAVMDDRETTTTQKGVYVVFLFREDGSGVYLTLNQGVTDPIGQYGVPEGIRALRRKAEALRPRIAALGTKGFSLDDSIDLRARPGL